ncbi:MAG: hypothetical protein IKD45_04410 [Clostridia bacterium]|nr:hypothetical protein [Clostridia bacterium]
MEYLTYEQFGAVGDGVTSDFDAIIACHNEANKTGTPVRARDGAEYYIDGRDLTAVIKTDVDFGTAKFIIDDRCVERICSYVFSIESDYPVFDISVDELNRETRSLPALGDGRYYVRVFDDEKKIFIRKGLNRNDGTAMTDCFVLETDGTIFPSVDWNYKKITRAYAKKIDDKPITVRGGIFVTIANEEASFYRYYQRGFNICRSNVTLCGFEHYVRNEGEHGAPYHGFVKVTEAVNVLISDAKITARYIYWTASKVPGKPVPMGSYDLSFYASIGITCKNVIQTTDIKDKRYWGIYTSNFCKELTLIGCVFSRFDAHQGVTNVIIKDCTLGHQSIQLIGHGDFLIENSVIDNDGGSFLNLRGDYGSIWDGKITVRGCIWRTKCQNLSVISAYNQNDHDYGYPCMMGKDIFIEGLTVTDSADTGGTRKNLSILGKYDNGATPEVNTHPYIPPISLTVKGITVAGDAGFTITEYPEKYKNLKVRIY